MNWRSAADFFAMGGYALYVWGSFGACALALALETLLVGKRHGAVLRSLRQQLMADRLQEQSP
ncbi:heme exporter protein CcmD [Caenimonas terrae]|uniref:Heme exporter protein D n=1 Tax=Caenimonas terrae TaxID=696074 RepID=A0ABW0NG53_9BURK